MLSGCETGRKKTKRNSPAKYSKNSYSENSGSEKFISTLKKPVKEVAFTLTEKGKCYFFFSKVEFSVTLKHSSIAKILFQM